MPYRTRPHLPNTILIPDPRKEYIVDGNRLTITDFFKGATEINLPAQRVDVRQNLIQKTADIGTVVLMMPSGQEYVCERINGPFNFKAALQGTHPDVTPPAPPWYTKFMDADLENFEIEIPSVPENIGFLYNNERYSCMPVGEIVAKEGEWVKKGEVIAFFHGGLAIHAPLSGKFTYGNHVAASHGQEWLDSSKWPKNEWDVIARIVPLKGQTLDGAIATAFEPIVAWTRHAWNNRNTSKGSYLFHNTIMPAFGENLIHELEMIRTAKSRVKPLKVADPNSDPRPER